MNKIRILSVLIIFVLLVFSTALSQFEAAPRASDMTINLVRSFSRDIFEINGVPYLQPLVESVNATSNSRFFNQAFVPAKVDKPYFKISINTMLGFISDKQKTYNPKLPTDSLDLNKLSQFVEFDITNPSNPIKSIKDTMGLIRYAFLVYTKKGYENGAFTLPEASPTVFGYGKAQIWIKKPILDSIVRAYPVIPIVNKPLYELLGDSLQKYLSTTIQQFPELFTLPEGSNMNTLFAGIPQLEVGSLFGTEALIRFVPKIDMGSVVGKFSFWGLGLKHSISQYFGENPPFDLAIQGVFQVTDLDNKIGVTNAEMDVTAHIYNLNIHASKAFDNFLGTNGQFDIYSGLSYEFLNIDSKYTYVISQETQWQLGLLRKDTIPPYKIKNPEPELGFPGDTVPQRVFITIDDTNIKWVVGMAYRYKWLSVFLDFNLSKFNIFTAGLEFKF